MATYYVSPTGNDFSGDGTSSLPWRHLERARLAATAGDTITVTGTTSTTLYRDSFTDSTGITINGATQQYISSMHNLTHGNTWERYELTTHCQATTGFTTTGTVAIDNTEKLYGAGCWKVGDGVSSSDIRYTTDPLMQGEVAAPCKFRIRVICKAASGKVAAVRMKANTANKWLDFSAGTWNAVAGNYFTMTSSTSWTEYVSAWFDNPYYDSFRMTFGSNSSTNIQYIQSVVIEYKADWTLHSGDIWKCAFPVQSSAYESVRLWKKSSAIDVDALSRSYLPAKASSLAAIAAGEYWHDFSTGSASNDGFMFYRLNTGETDATLLYFEAERGAVDPLRFTAAGNASKITSFGGIHGIYSNAAVTVTLTNCWSKGAINGGVQAEDGATIIMFGGGAEYTVGSATGTHGDGILATKVSSGGTIRCYGVLSRHCSDECFQASDAGSLELYACIGYYAGETTTTGGDVCAIETTLGVTNSKVQNCTFFCPSDEQSNGCLRVSIAATASSIVLRNNALICDADGKNTSYLDGTNGSATWTINKNRWGGDGSLVDAGTSNSRGGSAVAAADITSGGASYVPDTSHYDYRAFDFRLAGGSSLLAAGTPVFGVKDYTGKRYNPSRPDIGAYAGQQAATRSSASARTARS